MSKSNKFRLSNLDLSMRQICGSEDEKVILKNVYPVHKYVNDEKTEEIIGYSYLIELPHNESLYLYVKIPGAPLISKEDITSAGKLLVEFQGVKFSFYTNKRGYPDLSVTAEGLTIVKEGM